MEEDETVRQVVTALLGRIGGLSITTAEGGAESITLAGGENFDLVFMDVQMPGMDGLEATAAIRRGEDRRQEHRSYIVGLSAHAGEAHAEAGRAAGMDLYLHKPFSAADLRAAVAAARKTKTKSKGGGENVSPCT